MYKIKKSLILNLLSYVLLLTTNYLLLMCSEPTPPDPPINNEPDTTSHDFSWEFDSTGIYPSHIRDVFAISENSIWAVGEILTEETNKSDSLGNWIPNYNALHWNGKSWEKMRIQSKICNSSSYITRELYTVFGFADDDLWFSDGAAMIHWDGSKYTLYCQINSLLKGAISKIWGTDSQNLYIAGYFGTLVHYDGQNWTPMESYTDSHLLDVWGSPDGRVVWACGFDDTKGSILLRNTGNGFEKVVEVTEVPSNPIPNQIEYVFESLWTDTADSIFIGSNGRVYVAPANTTGYARESFWWDYSNEIGLPPATKALRGNSRNDLFAAGYLRFLVHYNGNSWKRYYDLEGEGYWYAIATLPDMVIVVGSRLVAENTIVLCRGYR